MEPAHASLGQLVDEGLGILAPRVEVPPVLAGVLLAEIIDRGLECFLLGGEYEGHVGHNYLPVNLGLRFSLKARTPSRRSSVVTVLL